VLPLWVLRTLVLVLVLVLFVLVLLVQVHHVETLSLLKKNVSSWGFMEPTANVLGGVVGLNYRGG
jgi:hypothetical protein